MSTVGPDEFASRLFQFCRLYLRVPFDYATDAVTGAPVFNFVPPLSGAEQTTFDRLAKLALSLVEGITPAEWQAIEPDIAGLVTYQGLANPTLAQTVLAVKAQSRILRALIRN